MSVPAPENRRGWGETCTTIGIRRARKYAASRRAEHPSFVTTACGAGRGSRVAGETDYSLSFPRRNELIYANYDGRWFVRGGAPARADEGRSAKAPLSADVAAARVIYARLVNRSDARKPEAIASIPANPIPFENVYIKLLVFFSPPPPRITTT